MIATGYQLSVGMHWAVNNKEEKKRWTIKKWKMSKKTCKNTQKSIST